MEVGGGRDGYARFPAVPIASPAFLDTVEPIFW